MIDIATAKAIPIEDVAMQLGLEVKAQKLRCISTGHQDASPSMSLDRRLNRFKCFGCGLAGDALDLVQIVMGFDLADAYNWLMGDPKLSSAAPIPQRDYRRVPRLGNVQALAAFYDLCAAGGDYLAAKGLSASRFGVREVTQAAHNLIPTFPVGGLFIPYFQHGVITYGRWRNQTSWGPKSLALAGVDVILYNQDSLAGLDGHKPLYLAEGETDTMSLATRGHVAIGFPGATQYQLIERLASWTRALGDKIPEVVLAFDDDDAGHRLNAKVREALTDLPVSDFDLMGQNDVNDWHQLH